MKINIDIVLSPVGSDTKSSIDKAHLFIRFSVMASTLKHYLYIAKYLIALLSNTRFCFS